MDSNRIKSSINDEEEQDNINIGVSYAANQSVQQSLNKAKIKYAKPDYNPKTRKQFYDDRSAHKKAMDNAFSKNETIKDPYTGDELYKSQKEAKAHFGINWQEHSAEADHIDPLHKFVERHDNDPFSTTENLREVGNDLDNFQVISRKLNQPSKEVGKGGSSQSEWADDQQRMKGLESQIKNGDSIENVSEKIRKTGEEAKKINDKKLFKKSVNNAIDTAHNAGVDAAKNSVISGFTISGIMNVVSVIQGEKEVDEAIADTLIVGGEAAVTGYVYGGGMTVLEHTLTYSKSEFMRVLGSSNVPGQVITAVVMTGETLKKWTDGDITTQECLLEIGEKGLNLATIGYYATIGQTMIPIPIVGGAVGALVGSLLTSSYYKSLISTLKMDEIEHEERMRIIRECNLVEKQYKEYRLELDRISNVYLSECRTCFDDALNTIQDSFNNGDINGVIQGTNTITKKLGGNVQYNTFDEFLNFIDSNEIDEF